MCKFGVPLMALRTQEEFIGTEKESEIRSVGTMTRAAFSFLHNRVFILILLIPYLPVDVLMTVKAYFILSCLFEVFMI